MRHTFSGIIVRYLSDTKKLAECTCNKNSAPPPLAGQEPDLSQAPGPSAPVNSDSTTSRVAYAATRGLRRRKAVSLCDMEREDELHVNLWETGRDRISPFMDVGVMIGLRDLYSAVVVDLPWNVELKDVSDLGARLNGEKSVAAIFNEVVHYDGFAEGNFANISFRKDGKDEKPFSLLRLNTQLFKVEPIFLSDENLCTRLTITLPSRPTFVEPEDIRKSAYIRFRIRNIPTSVYSMDFMQKDRALISSNTETRIIDFRINVLRGVPEELLSGNEKLNFPKFQRIHCFLTTIRDEICVSDTKDYKGYRSLMDEEVWNEYIRLDNSVGVSEENSVRNYIGYQWTASRERGSVKDLIVLGRFSKIRSDYSSIARFVALVMIFGASGSAIWDISTTCLIKSFPDGCGAKIWFLLMYFVIGFFLIIAEPLCNYIKKGKRRR
ncbi:hypothetical protein [Pseudomonas syringae]|uniref:hypothetical protein n=1 Tax=Pseudomonas syringae TaxID=317 RepID=UPI001BCE22B6|nr:hypothetical protein [Pseudomonas syringae]MBS7435859.1 hypothetical protein [Pseudomonas syringae]MBS7460646.1 hypothetical protein [Pseudomonas syringae]